MTATPALADHHTDEDEESVDRLWQSRPVRWSTASIPPEKLRTSATAASCRMSYGHWYDSEDSTEQRHPRRALGVRTPW